MSGAGTDAGSSGAGASGAGTDAGSARSADAGASPVGPAVKTAPGATAPSAAYDGASCTACHGELLQRKSKHGIFNKGGCPDCHLPAEAPGKCKTDLGRGWKLVKGYPELCTGCHQIANKTPLHPPIVAMGCKPCHDPHGSDNRKLLKRWPADQLCYRCHDRKDEKENVHTAVKLSLCVGCHNPHSGEESPLLRAPRDKVCFRCHDLESIAIGSIKHVPVMEGRCLDCHDPHTSENPKQTRAKGKALCLTCHDSKARGGIDRPRPTKRVDLTKKNVHKPVELGKCQTCHEQTHTGENLKFLKKPPPDLCYGCHDRKDDKKFTHSALRVGDCPVCHNPHSSDNPTLLWDPPSSRLCFRCHQDDVTGRNFVHRPVALGMCMACHDPHGADNRFNLKPGTGKQVCYSCHKVKDEVEVKHRALERYGCTACHDPHGTANRFMLIKPVNDLCQSCHLDKKDGLHATTFVAGGHRISGEFDPRRPGRRFTCASCHNPHGSNNQRMFYFGENAAEMCDGCHGDRTGKNPELKDIHNTPPKGDGVDAGASLLDSVIDAGTFFGPHLPPIPTASEEVSSDAGTAGTPEGIPTAYEEPFDAGHVVPPGTTPTAAVPSPSSEVAP
ncbi:MAG: cytochrome c3 family protein [Myxococcales bacterium]|nr:cytochrome c3 family protein [Myxococcales bacterium]